MSLPHPRFTMPGISLWQIRIGAVTLTWKVTRKSSAGTLSQSWRYGGIDCLPGTQEPVKLGSGDASLYPDLDAFKLPKIKEAVEHGAGY